MSKFSFSKSEKDISFHFFDFLLFLLRKYICERKIEEGSFLSLNTYYLSYNMADPISLPELESKVTLNPYAEENYSVVLEHYQDLCDKEDDADTLAHEKLNELRVQYALYCNPPPSFWLSWLTDCVIVANTDSAFVQKVVMQAMNIMN